MQCRSGEASGTHFRTDRYFCISGEWFFSTRENLQIGPFATRDDAEIELLLFLRHIQEGGIYAEHASMNYSQRVRSLSDR